VSNVFIVANVLRDRYFIRKMDFTHISSWLELSMEGYLIAISVYVEGKLGTEMSVGETIERCCTYLAAIGNGDVLHRTIAPAFRDVLYGHLRYSKECGQTRTDR
jgi:hypothetical protein